MTVPASIYREYEYAWYVQRFTSILILSQESGAEECQFDPHFVSVVCVTHSQAEPSHDSHVETIRIPPRFEQRQASRT
jgi:hypothetical protein